MNILTDKRCSGCREWKSKSEFTKDKTRKDGLKIRCKACRHVDARKWQIANADRERDRQRRRDKNHPELYKNRYQKEKLLNPEKLRTKWQKWRDANADKARAAFQKWAHDNPDKKLESDRKWRKNHPEKNVEYQNNYRALKKGNGGRITAQEWQALKKHYNFTCLCCRRQEPEIKLTLDHVIPVSPPHYGLNSIKNAQPLCKSCNSKKGARHIDYRP